MPNTIKHPDLIGNGSQTALFAKRLDITTFGTDTDALDCLYITYSPKVAPGSAPSVSPNAATVTVTAATNVITLAVKNHGTSAANSDVSFAITPAAAKVAWSAGAASAYTLKDVIDLINEVDAGGTSGKLLDGFKCSIGPGGMYDMIVDQTASGFQAEAAQYIQPAGTAGERTSFFKKDMAVYTIDTDFLCTWRLGLPEVRDRGLLKLLDLYGAIGTDTGVTVSVVTDDVSDFVEPVGTWATDYANHQEYYAVSGANLPSNGGATSNSLNHNPIEAAALRGPLVVIVKGDTDAAQTVTLNAVIQAC